MGLWIVDGLAKQRNCSEAAKHFTKQFNLYRRKHWEKKRYFLPVGSSIQFNFIQFEFFLNPGREIYTVLRIVENLCFGAILLQKIAQTRV